MKFKVGDKVLAKIKYDAMEYKSTGHPGIIQDVLENEKHYPYWVKHLDENDSEAYNEDELTLLEEPNNILKKICD